MKSGIITAITTVGILVASSAFATEGGVEGTTGIVADTTGVIVGATQDQNTSFDKLPEPISKAGSMGKI